jgi:hypothetical protein
VQQRHAEEAVVLPVRHRQLVELEQLEEEVALGREGHERDDNGQPDDQPRQRERRPGATALREVPPRCPRVARLLGEPPEPVRDLGLLRGGRPPLGLTVGGDRSAQVAGPDASRGDLAPGPVRARRLGQLEDRLPGGDGRLVLVEPVERLPEAEQGGRGDRRIIETDDAPVVDRRLAVITRIHQLRRPVEHGRRILAVERSLDAELRGRHRWWSTASLR